AQAALARLVGVGRDEPSGPRPARFDVLQDDGRLGEGQSVSLVPEDGELAKRPQGKQRIALRGVRQVHDVFLEGNTELVETDEHLLAKGRKRVKMEGERAIG